MDVNMTHLTMVIIYLERMLEKNPKDSLFVTLAIEMLTSYKQSLDNGNKVESKPTGNANFFDSLDMAISYHQQMADLLQECKEMQSSLTYISDGTLDRLLEYLSTSMKDSFYNYSQVSKLVKDYFKK